MSALYRFGFEGGHMPNGVSVVGSYTSVSGRSGPSSNAIASANVSGESFVSITTKEPSNSVFVSEHIKFLNYGVGQTATLATFGSASIEYSLTDQRFRYRIGGSQVWQSPIVIINTGIYVPMSFGFVLANTSGSIETIVDSVPYTFNGDTTAGAEGFSYPTTVQLGLGSANTLIPQIAVDDVSINNNVQRSNTSGSYGTSDVGYPPFIRALQTKIASTGSTFQWDDAPDLISVVNGDTTGSSIIAHGYNLTATFLPQPIPPTSIISFEGANIYTIGAQEVDTSDTVYFDTFLKPLNSASINQADSVGVGTLPIDYAYSAFEKDLGGKIDINDFNSGSITIVTRRFINKNFFGIGDLGSVVFDGNVVIDSSAGDFVVLDYANLLVPSGSSLTVSNKCRGLVIYVRENCVIEGKISMDGKGLPGTLGDLPLDLWKNVSSSFQIETASLVSTILQSETENQPVCVGTSSWFGLNQLSNPDQTLIMGGGGRGGSSSFTPGGNGGTSSFWAGGSGGGGAVGPSASMGLTGSNAVGLAQGGGQGIQFDTFNLSGTGGSDGGGALYIFAGKNLILGPSALLSATGSNGSDGASDPIHYAGGGGGAGGGSINIFYGENFYNLSGSINVSGGLGGSGSMWGGENGHSGASGSVRLFQLLTN